MIVVGWCVGWCGFSSLLGKGRIGGNGHNKNKKEEVGWVVGREETRNLGGAIVWLVQWGVVAKYRIQKIQNTMKDERYRCREEI